jgi:hypothetical protein
MKFIKEGDWYEVVDNTESLGYVEKSVSRLTGSNVWKIFTAEGKPIKEQMGNISDQRGYCTRAKAVEALRECNKIKESDYT